MLLKFCRWNFEEGRPSANFDTFPVALLTVFQVNSMLSDTLSSPLYNHYIIYLTRSFLF